LDGILCLQKQFKKMFFQLNKNKGTSMEF